MFTFYAVCKYLSNSNILFITGLDVLAQFTKTESYKTRMVRDDYSRV